ncbi:hypothetical protein EU803_10715 [Loktanella sp. IMCC34160]|uniref:hypothetical protein n=1 Tax=Loktanella sp. IMCC34160 TaxID=2510646 RepID=UPI00101CD9A1|nr:hypothetical protein [Loktanella sp. IMCC34160]RYG91550.1 hypothetical protein EU803_10715 [Loktanella sp. IMCC34160]
MYVPRMICLAATFAMVGGAALADTIRLPPSVGATPIEIPYVDPDAPLAINPNALGQSGQIGTQTPRLGDPYMVLPVPLPSPNITMVDPRRLPGAFSSLPIPIPDPVRVGREGRFAYALLNDGTVYGDTNFGYARFENMATYRAFLESH